MRGGFRLATVRLAAAVVLVHSHMGARPCRCDRRRTHRIRARRPDATHSPPASLFGPGLKAGRRPVAVGGAAGTGSAGEATDDGLPRNRGREQMPLRALAAELPKQSSL